MTDRERGHWSMNLASTPRREPTSVDRAGAAVRMLEVYRALGRTAPDWVTELAQAPSA